MDKKKLRAWLLIILFFLVLAVIGYFLSPQAKRHQAKKLQAQAQEKIARGDYLEGEIYLRKAIEKEPNNSELRVQLGEVLEKQGVLEEAKEEYLRAFELKPEPEPRYKAGMVLLKQGKREEAEKLFEENLSEYPEHIPTLYQLGWLNARVGKFEQAKEYFQKIIKLKPDEAEAYNNLGFCLYNLGQPEQAKEMFEQALKLRPNFPEAKKSLEMIEKELEEKEQKIESNQTCPVCE